MKPTLFVLAAGMGSRYGGLKQLDGLGPNGETIMDYSIFDAIRGGFGKVVFVIRKDFEADFRTKILSKYENHIPVEVVFQSVDDLPEGFVRPEGRTKPWGTNHAVLMGKAVIREPFAVINADDFYGAEAYQTIGDYLSQLGDSKNRYCMVAYDLNRTLSDNGTVSRGVCGVDADGNLTSMVERTQIERMPDGRILFHDGGADEELAEDTPVSMNLWGLTPDIFGVLEEEYKKFLATADLTKDEFFIPSVISKAVDTGRATVRVFKNADKWYGITYREDLQEVKEAIGGYIHDGMYKDL